MEKQKALEEVEAATAPSNCAREAPKKKITLWFELMTFGGYHQTI